MYVNILKNFINSFRLSVHS